MLKTQIFSFILLLAMIGSIHAAYYLPRPDPNIDYAAVAIANAKMERDLEIAEAEKERVRTMPFRKLVS